MHTSLRICVHIPLNSSDPSPEVPQKLAAGTDAYVMVLQEAQASEEAFSVQEGIDTWFVPVGFSDAQRNRVLRRISPTHVVSVSEESPSSSAIALSAGRLGIPHATLASDGKTADQLAGEFLALLATMAGQNSPLFPHPATWTPEKVGNFWNFVSARPGIHSTYFSYQVGTGVANFLRTLVPHHLNGRILDFGAGPGYLTEKLLQGQGMVKATDYSSESMEQLNAKFCSKGNWRGCVSFENGELGCRDGEFDLITCVETIEHILEPALESTILELKRALNPGAGLLFITTPNNENLELNTVICPDCSAYFHRWQHQRTYTQASLSSFMERLGFRTVLCTATEFGLFQAPHFSPVSPDQASRELERRLGQGNHLLWIGGTA